MSMHVLEYRYGFKLRNTGREMMNSGGKLRSDIWQGEDHTFLVVGASKSVEFHSVFWVFPIPTMSCEQQDK